MLLPEWAHAFKENRSSNKEQVNVCLNSTVRVRTNQPDWLQKTLGSELYGDGWAKVCMWLICKKEIEVETESGRRKQGKSRGRGITWWTPQLQQGLHFALCWPAKWRQQDTSKQFKWFMLSDFNSKSIKVYCVFHIKGTQIHLTYWNKKIPDDKNVSFFFVYLTYFMQY